MKKNIPQHIAFIMDGNRRWAKKNNLPSINGHKKGAQNLEKIIIWAGKKKIKTITVYALSSENFTKRSKTEINYLMKLLKNFMLKKKDVLQKHGAQLNILGDISVFPKDVTTEIENCVRDLKDNKKIILNMALNYGGRAEIVNATKNIIKENISPTQITEENFAKFLYTKKQSDPEILIRTGGDLRISNFLLWQLAYSELFFTNTLWPDLKETELEKILLDYQKRQKRYGK